VVLAVAGVVLAVAPGHSTASSSLRGAPRPGTPAAPCQASGPANGQTRVLAWKSPQDDVECVGYSGSGFVFTNHTPADEDPLQALQDERLQFDQQQVFQLNQQADQGAENGRTEFSLVYFAGITAGPDENYDSGQAEELEGLMVAQQYELQGGSGPVFKVIIANGGSKMQAAVPVARMITALATRDSSLLGVVGLDRSMRDQSGLGEPAISYVTNGIAVLNTGSECLHTVTAEAAQASGEPFSSFCMIYASIVKKLFNLPKVQGNGLNFLWTGERVGLAFDAAELFIDAEENYQSSHPAIGRAEIPGQFISNSWQGVTGQIDFTSSQHIAGLPLAVVRIKISSPTATPTCEYPGQGQLFGPGPSTGPCPDGSD
jgi:hypothetical protein